MYANENILIQNLKDAGCDLEMSKQFITKLKCGKTEEGLKILEVHRRSILNEIHAEQKKIDCLDYLVYQVNSSK